VADQLKSETSHNPIDLLATAISAHVEILLQLGDFASASSRTMNQLPIELRAEHEAAQASYASLWDDLLRSALTSGSIRDDVDVDVARKLILGAINSTVEWFDESPMESSELAHTVVDLVIGGIAARRRELS
jgi:hypothetical protein